MICELLREDIDDIMDLEKRAFDPAIRAPIKTVLRRFSLGHISVGYRDTQNILQGAIGFSYGRFDPADTSTIPDTFAAWANQSVPENYNTVFIYSLGISPQARGMALIKTLVSSCMQRAARDGCTQALCDAPIPSYNGSSSIPLKKDVRDALDGYAKNGIWPLEERLFRDPHLALYRKLRPCRVARIAPGFLPEDAASGGFRVLLFQEFTNQKN